MVRRGFTKRSWSDVVPPGNMVMCCSIFSVLPRSAPGRATTRQPTAFTSEAIALSFNPSVSADARVGQGRGCPSTRRPGAGAGAARRGRQLLPRLGPPGWTDRRARRAGVVGTRRGKPDDAMAFAADAAEVASLSRDPAVQLLAATGVAAVKALAEPTQLNIGSLPGARSTTHPGLVVRQPQQFHRRAGCRSARRPPRASGR